MALTTFQLEICRLIARQRVESGESYVAGGTALNSAIGAARISRDIDLFHDTVDAVEESFSADRQHLAARGYEISIERQRAGFVEAIVIRGRDRVVLQWAADSAFRYFPLVEHPDFGLVLHPFDLATNKVLALVGRVEARDWVDVIHCHERVQQLGFLAWAASGKDPGFGPSTILEQAARTARYSVSEIAGLDFEGPPPDAADLARKWHRMVDEAREIVTALPPADVGRCVLDERGELFSGEPTRVRAAVASGEVRFHEGRIRGALPELRDQK